MASGRSRDGGCPPPPPRIRTSGFPASGSCLRSERQAAGPAGFTYPFQRMRRASPVLRPERGLLAQVPLGQAPSLPLLRPRSAGVVRSVRRYYGPVRLPLSVHRRRASPDFPARPAAPSPRAGRGSPGSRARCVRTCSGSSPAQDLPVSCDSDAGRVAFRLSPRRRRPGVGMFSRLHTRPAHPLSTLRRCLRRHLRMTRGRCGSLNLHRTTLAFAILRRFTPAHGDPFPFRDTTKQPERVGMARR